MSDLQKWKRWSVLNSFYFLLFVVSWSRCCYSARQDQHVSLQPSEGGGQAEGETKGETRSSERVCLLEKQEVRLNLVSDKTVWVMLLTLWLFIFLSLRVACSLHSASLWQICPSPVKTCPLWCSTTPGECMNTQITAAACDYQLRPCSASPLCIRTLDSSQAICI